MQAWAGPISKTSKSLPTELIGTWQVIKVNIDTGATRKRSYQYNDPRLKGRIFIIDRDTMSFNTPEHMTCRKPTITSTVMTAAALIKDSVGWRGFDPEIPTPKDFELPFTAKSSVEVLNIGCEDGLWGNGLGRADAIDNAWIIALPKGQLAMHWFDDTILIMSRLPANAKPKPSFDCTKAKIPAEKTICGSIELASFDLSVSKSYKQNIEGFTEGKDTSAVKRVKAAQKAWLKKRDACGTDAACLKKSMEDQLEAMANLESFYLPR